MSKHLQNDHRAAELRARNDGCIGATGDGRVRGCGSGRAMSEKTVLGKTLAEVLTMKPSVELDTIGELVVFGNTLQPKHDDDLTAALESILFQMSCENVYHFAVPGVPGYSVVPVLFNAERPYNPAYKSNYRLWAWHNRKGQDYAEALERRVAEFRMTPRPLSSSWEGSGMVIGEMAKREFAVSFSNDGVFYPTDTPHKASFQDYSKPFTLDHGCRRCRSSNTPHLAVLLAAIWIRWDEVAA